MCHLAVLVGRNRGQVRATSLTEAGPVIIFRARSSRYVALRRLQADFFTTSAASPQRAIATEVGAVLLVANITTPDEPDDS